MRKLNRFIFSRYFVSAIMILLSVAFVFTVIFVAYNYSIYIYLFMMFLSFVTNINIINKETVPEFKLPWMMVVTVIPIFGMLLYFMFYSRRLTRKEARLMDKIYREYEAAVEAVRKENAELMENLDELGRDDALALGKARAIMFDDYGADLYRNTSSKYFPLGEELFASMIADMKRAEKYIFLEYFIVEEGALWDRLYSVLRDKARAGVDVRLLYDDIGCMYTLSSTFPKKLARDGIKCQRVGKIIPRISTVHHNRDHRKICVIDGAVAYTGGVNIADEYTNEKNRFGHWKDGGIRLEGHAVLGLLKLFITMWDFTEGRVSNYRTLFTSIGERIEGDGGYYIPFGSGPAPTYPASVGENAILNLINQSKSYIYITTPYLIIDYALTEALKNAARRGVEVVIVTPGKADKHLVKVMTKSFYPQLISAGVKIYEYTPGFMHEKLIVSDDCYAMVGTINMDYRSLVHHYENAVWMYNTPVVEDIKRGFMKTLSISAAISAKDSKLKLSQKIAKDLIRIFAPLL